MDWTTEHRTAVQVLWAEAESRGGLAALARDCELKPGTLGKVLNTDAVPTITNALKIQQAVPLPLLCLIYDMQSPIRSVLEAEAARLLA